MKKMMVVLALILLGGQMSSAQEEVYIDGRLKPLLDNFFQLCKEYDIEYHEKLFKLKTIQVVNTFIISQEAMALGILRRDKAGTVTDIHINWVSFLDPEIGKVVAFHEFAHYFLEYSEHSCYDCGLIMSEVNSSYFDIARDWDRQIKLLFEESPAYQKKQTQKGLSVVN